MTGRLIVLVLALLAPMVARAAPSQEELARSHFVAGEEEYARGRWQEALHEFQLGYALSPRPEFLINFAQVYRRLGDYDAAERECQRYLATAPPSELAAQAERLLQQIREERPKLPPPTTPPKPSPPPVAAPPVAAPPVAAPPPALVASPTPPPPKRKRTWIAPVVVSCVLVAAAAVTVGLVFGLPRSDTFKTTPLGTVDFR
ncbi:MAG TPA: tetratricopeptide repeat protein [Polyangia bacterium]